MLVKSVADLSKSELHKTAFAIDARRIFSRVGNEGVWRTEIRQQGPEAEPRWESGVEAPKSWRYFLKIMHKYFIYWDFRQHLKHKKHFTTCPRKCPPYLCLPTPMAFAAFSHMTNLLTVNKCVIVANIVHTEDVISHRHSLHGSAELL